METISSLIDIVLHLNVYLDSLATQYGVWIYAILFLVVFCETGLVATPFLPGDSLLFAAGALSAGGRLNIFALCALLTTAAILGDTVNYWVGKLAGETLAKKYPRVVKPAYLERTRAFYLKYGGKTLIIARFVPIVRTFAPFVAGVGKMPYHKFWMFNVTGAVLWVLVLVPAGHIFANVPFVKENFSLVIFAIIILSVMPAVYEVLKNLSRAPKPS